MRKEKFCNNSKKKKKKRIKILILIKLIKMITVVTINKFRVNKLAMTKQKTITMMTTSSTHQKRRKCKIPLHN